MKAKIKAKTILSLITLCLLSLTLNACGGFMRGYGQEAGANGKKDKGFKNARGGSVWGCDKYPIKAAEGGAYLDTYGLPREIGGNFICDGDTPKLPKDCQGREFRSEAELRAYWDKYQLPVGLVRFDCSTGIPKIRPQYIDYWKIEEQNKPTCKDSRGRRRPCV